MCIHTREEREGAPGDMDVCVGRGNNQRKERNTTSRLLSRHASASICFSFPSVSVAFPKQLTNTHPMYTPRPTHPRSRGGPSLKMYTPNPQKSPHSTKSSPPPPPQCPGYAPRRRSRDGMPAPRGSAAPAARREGGSRRGVGEEAAQRGSEPRAGASCCWWGVGACCESRKRPVAGLGRIGEG